MKTDHATRSLFLSALSAFVVAGLAGLVFRWGMLRPLPEDFHLGNIRHAHSHLMVFGWITPTLLAFISHRFVRTEVKTSITTALNIVTMLCVALGFLSFPAFWEFGYRAAPIGGAQVPLAVMISALNMLAWYLYVVLYGLAEKREVGEAARRFLHTALFFLVVSTLGAWLLAATNSGALTLPWQSKTLSHWFLYIFKEGWCIFALLALYFARREVRPAPNHLRLVWWGLIIGIPLSFPLALPTQHNHWDWIGSLAAVLSGMSLCSALFLIKPQLRAADALPAGFLAVKAILLPIVAFLHLQAWIHNGPVKIFYLHILMLGAVSGFLFSQAAAFRYISRTGLNTLYGALLLMMLSLVLLLPFQPFAVLGINLHRGAFLGAMIMVLASGAQLIIGLLHEQDQTLSVKHEPS